MSAEHQFLLLGLMGELLERNSIYIYEQLPDIMIHEWITKKVTGTQVLVFIRFDVTDCRVPSGCGRFLDLHNLHFIIRSPSMTKCQNGLYYFKTAVMV